MCNVSRIVGNPQKAVAAEARAAEMERQAQVNAALGRVNETFGRFNDPFFQQREQAFTAYAMPQLDDQFARARRDLIFALSGSGLTNSSVGAQRLADLERDYGMRRTQIADEARAFGQQARADVEQARSSLIQQAQATGDASLAGNAAINEANRLAASPTFSPLGALFGNVAAGVGVARNAREAEQVRQQVGARIYQPNQASGRVVN